MQPVGTPNDTPSSLRQKAREFLRLAGDDTASPEMPPELNMLAQ
jgi:hypothetical protein